MPGYPSGLRLAPLVGLVLAMLFTGPARAAVQGQSGSNIQQVPVRLNLRVAATPQGVVATWQSVPGATRYVVHRWRMGTGSRCCELDVPAGTALRYVDAALPGGGRYLYRVVAHLSGGRRGHEERTIQVAAPTATAAAPEADVGRQQPDSSSRIATLVNPNRPGDIARRLPSAGTPSSPPGSQPPDQGATGQQPVESPYRSQGPLPVLLDLAPSGTAAPPATSGSHATPPAAGAQPVYPPHRQSRPQIPMEPQAGPSVTTGAGGSTTPPAQSGRYLVSVIGLHAGSVTTDNLLHEDGKGDEVFAAAIVRRYDRGSAELLESTKRQTTVYGDVQGRGNERTQAGSLSPMGGIGNGDPIPGDAPAARLLPAQDRVFPWKLWEGTLTAGADALVISPSIWEYDGRPALFDAWVANQSALTSTLFFSQRLQDQINARALGPLALGASEASHPRWVNEVNMHAPAIIAVAFGLPPVLNLEGQDRPIGLLPGPSLPNTTVVLTREIIESALAGPSLGLAIPTSGLAIPLPKPGIIAINFEDKWRPSITDRLAFYSMVLQVERLP